MSGANFSRIKTWGAEVLTYSDLNAEFDNILTNLTPAGMDDESANAAAMQATSDPYPAGTASLATSLQGELRRLRYMLQQQSGMAQWYHDPVDTIWIPASAMIPLGTNPAAPGTYEYATNDIDVDYFAFDAGATEENAGFNIVMPDTWNLGTVKAKFFWTSPTGSTAGDTVEWQIKAGAYSNNDALDAALGTAQVISDTLLADNGAKLQVSDATPELTIGGTPALGDMIHFRVSRNTDGTDDMTEDAWLLGVLIQFTKGSTAGAAW